MGELRDLPGGGQMHESSYVDEGATVGKGTKIWHFCHVQSGSTIGERCSLGQNVNVGNDVVIGNNVKIQNNVSIYTGTDIEDDVFLGPSCVLTNVTNPRSQVIRRGLYERTLLRRGATIGANATIVCGITLGAYCFVAAGSVVVKDVPAYALVMGNPARQKGWMSRHGHRLSDSDSGGIMTCPESSLRYRLEEGRVRCIDLEEEADLPEELARGRVSYDDIKALQLGGANR
jgi:UDP-2-acetamido-3-amino-2,3-dideoxy-glucuronate N-acetyltransferase